MSMNTDLLKNLICPRTGERLCVATGNSELSKPLRQQFGKLGAPTEAFTQWVFNQSGTYAYPVFKDVLVLISDMAVAWPQEKPPSTDSKGLLVNPFAFSGATKVRSIEACGRIFSFKAEQFRNHIPYTSQIVVEFMSAEGTILKRLALMDSCLRVAVDLDFWALFNGHTSGIHKVCADATISCFGPSSIDCAFSNSTHHIPAQSEKFYRDILVSLKSGGRFVGIELQGLLAKLTLETVLRVPRLAMPHSIKAIDDERDLLREWLRVPIAKRLAKAGIRSFDCNKTLFHAVYSFSKAAAMTPPHAQRTGRKPTSELCWLWRRLSRIVGAI